MRFALSTRIFRLRSLTEAIEAIAAAGFRAVELLADRPHAFPDDLHGAEVNAFNHCVGEHKIRVTNLNSCVATALGDNYHPSWIEEDWQERERRIRFTLDCLRLAAAMGIPNVSTGAGGVIPATMNHSEAWRLFIANMHRVVPLAARLGVKLLLQPEPDMLLQTSQQMVKFIQEVGLESVGVNFNVAHLYCAGEDPCEAWDRLRSYVCHVELSDVPENRSHRHVQLGEGAIDIPAFLQCIEDSGYEGYISIEMESNEREPEPMVSAAVEYLRNKGFLSDSGDSN